MSLNASDVMVIPVTLVKVMVITVAIFAPTVVAANDFCTCGLAICSVALADAVLVPPLVNKLPTGITLPYEPPTDALT